jgi:hypothetical protein
MRVAKTSCSPGCTAMSRRGSPGWKMNPVADVRPRTTWQARSSMRRPASRHPARGISRAACVSPCSLPCLSRRFRLLLSCSSVRRYLHQLGWRWARPRLAPARKPDLETEAKRTALAQAQAQARQGLAHLLYLDESDLHLLPLIRAMWMRRPTSTHSDSLAQSASGLLWCPGCCQWAVVFCRS